MKKKTVFLRVLLLVMSMLLLLTSCNDGEPVETDPPVNNEPDTPTDNDGEDNKTPSSTADRNYVKFKNPWKTEEVTAPDGKTLIIRTVKINIDGEGDPIEIFQMSDTHFNAIYKDAAHTEMIDDWNVYGKQSASLIEGEDASAVSSWNEWGDLLHADRETILPNSHNIANYVRCINYAANADRIMVTGDIMNYYSNANMDLMEKYVFNAKTNVNPNMTAKIIALGGNHDATLPAVSVVDANKAIHRENQAKLEAMYKKYDQDLRYYSEVIDEKVMIIQMDNAVAYDLAGDTFTVDQKNKLEADIAKAHEKGYIILLFYHIPLDTNNTDGGDDFGGYNKFSAVDKAVYNLITNNADVIKGCFAGHTHAESNTNIAAKTSDGRRALIPQYVVGAMYSNDGEMVRVVIE